MYVCTGGGNSVLDETLVQSHLRDFRIAQFFPRTKMHVSRGKGVIKSAKPAENFADVNALLF